MVIVSLELWQTLADSRAKLPEVLPIQQLISVYINAFDAILEQRNTKLLTFLTYLSSSFIEYLFLGLGL